MIINGVYSPLSIQRWSQNYTHLSVFLKVCKIIIADQLMMCFLNIFNGMPYSIHISYDINVIDPWESAVDEITMSLLF